MRIKVVLRTEKLPVIYHHRIQSLIKEAIKIGNSEYKKDLYESKSPRPFSFSIAMPPEKQMKKETIQIDKNFSIQDTVFHFKDVYPLLVISSCDYNFLVALYNGLLKLKTFNFSSDEEMLINGEKIEIKLERITNVTKPEIKSSELVFKTLSPIIIEDSNDKPVLHDNENFNAILNEIQNKIFSHKNLKGEKLSEALEFTPVKVEKQVMKHTLKEFREKTNKPIMYLTGIKGIFKLKGDPKDLEIIYNMGLGNRTGQGFGMIVVLG
jgi:CRISPR-associated endoribonuclease Cas6